MSAAEERKTELEVLHSIFDGDERFTVISDNKFQYKFGEDGENKSFLLEISWPDTYPEAVPDISLDLFYNSHVLPKVKENIKATLLSEAEACVGMAVTFTLIEYVRDNFEHLMRDQVETLENNDDEDEESSKNDDDVEEAVAGIKKVHMTKAQKRRMWDHTDASKLGEKERGWNWVDIIKHLSQTRDTE